MEEIKAGFSGVRKKNGSAAYVLPFQLTVVK